MTLTEAGEQKVDAVVPFVRKVNDLLFCGFSVADIQFMHGFLATLESNSELALAEIRNAKRGGRRAGAAR